MQKHLTLFLLVTPLFASGCVPLIVSGGTEAAVTVAQERSIGDSLDDKGIYLKLKQLYAEKDFGDLFGNVEVKVIEGRVLLTGNVDKPETQVEAVRIAWTVGGVKEVINEIQINDQSGIWNYTKDVWISNRLRTQLLITKNIRSINYSVVTVNQVVYVMGIAQDQQELDRVTYIASTISGVKKVVSYAQLKSDTRRPGGGAQPE